MKGTRRAQHERGLRTHAPGGLAALLAVAAVLPAAAMGAVPGAKGKIAFTSGRDGNNEIYVMDPDGGGQTNLTRNPAVDVRPAWSPDGTKIAFSSGRDGNDEVYVMDADGGNQTNLTRNAATDEQPSWSPDGRKIAFRTFRDGNNEIYVVNADGSDPRNLSQNPANEATPAWSPDGSQIAFRSNRDGGNEDIWVMNADGSGATNLTRDPASNDSFPNWSPDGKRIAYQKSPGAPEIYVMNADGSGQTNITQNAAGDQTPAWSPDGSKIAFDSDRTAGDRDVFVMNPDGSDPSNVTRTAGLDFGAAWQSVDRAPACQGSSASTPQDTPVTIQLSCADPDGNPLSYAVARNPLGGSLGEIAQPPALRPFLQPPAPVSISYTPRAGFGGPDSFEYTASDGRLTSDPAVVTIEVGPAVLAFSVTKRIVVSKKPTAVVAAKRGGVFLYALSAPARVQIAIAAKLPGRRVGASCNKPTRRLRHRPRCTRFVPRGTLTRSGIPGANKTGFSGRIGRRALARGAYRATITAFDAGGAPSEPKSAGFRIVTRR